MCACIHTVYRHSPPYCTSMLLPPTGQLLLNSAALSRLVHTCTYTGYSEFESCIITVYQDPALWACLAGMATSARDLNTAEIAYAAIDEVCSYTCTCIRNHVHYVGCVRYTYMYVCYVVRYILTTHNNITNVVHRTQMERLSDSYLCRSILATTCIWKYREEVGSHTVL